MSSSETPPERAAKRSIPAIVLVDERAEALEAVKAALAQSQGGADLTASREAALESLLDDERAVLVLDVAKTGIDGFIAEVWRQAKGRLRRYEGMCETERRERERLEALYNTTFEEAPIGIGHVSPDLTWVRVNRRIGEIFGASREQIEGRHLLDLVHPDSAHALSDALRKIAAGEEPKNKGEYEFFRHDGSVAWLGIRLTLIRDREGNAVQLATVEDVSERRGRRQHLERRLEASERRFMRLREVGVVAVFDVAADGRLVDANDAFGQLSGYSPEEVRAGGVRLEDLRVRDRADADERADRELAEIGFVGAYETTIMCKDGFRKEVIIGGVSADGFGAGSTAIALDVTALKAGQRRLLEMTRALEESVRARDDFLFIAAHELRNPLTPLLMQMTNLAERADRAKEPLRPEWLAEQLAPAVRATKRLSHLIDNLLDLSRLRVGRMSLEIQSLDFVELVRGVMERLAPQAEKAGCAVTYAGDAHAYGSWDRIRIEQVLENLLTNAIKYGGDNPIELNVTSSETTIECSVQDHGIGIDQSDQNRIFERFERVGSFQDYGGFGLGLWIARQIVEAHGGAISVASEVGHGTRFTMRLPRVSAPVAESEGARQ
jgi:PAS domain S-box-containing protein